MYMNMWHFALWQLRRCFVWAILDAVLIPTPFYGAITEDLQLYCDVTLYHVPLDCEVGTVRRCNSLHARFFFHWKFSGACIKLRCLFWPQIDFFLSLSFYLWGWWRRRTALPLHCEKARGKSGEGQARGNSQVNALPSTCPQWIFNGRHSSNASAKIWVYKNFWDAALWQWFCPCSSL